MNEIRSKLTVKTPEQRQWRCSDLFIVNFEDILDLVVVFLLLTVIAGWVLYCDCENLKLHPNTE